MNKQTDSFDKALDLLLDEAAEGANEAIGNALGETTEEHIFSKGHEDKMQKLFKMEKRKLWLRKTTKYTKRVACLVAVILVTMGVAIGSVDAWRTRFLNFVLEIGKPNTHFNFGGLGSTTYSDDKVTLYYIPEGFNLRESDITVHGYTLMFANDNQYFQFDMSGINVNFSIDTEDGTAEWLTINGYEAVYTSNPNINAVIWHDGETVFMVLGTIEKNELIKIAENVEKNKN